MPYPKVIHFVQSVLSLFSHLPTVPFYQTFISRTHAVRFERFSCRQQGRLSQRSAFCSPNAIRSSWPQVCQTAVYSLLSCQSWHEHAAGV